MDSFKTFFESLDDIFADLGKSKVTRKETKVVPYVLKLWRGFRGDLASFDQGDHYLFTPDRSEQGLLWFTHPFINYYDPVQYAKDHGDWLLTWQLNVKRHVETTHWDDGSNHDGQPDYWHKLADSTKNGQFYAGIELPAGWVFTYKAEKFVGCQMPLRVPKTAVTPVSAELDS